MKTIGLLGGMSFESTIEYYRIINREVRKRLGGNNSAKILLHSFNFQEIEDLQKSEKWQELEKLICEAGQKLHESGADFLLICTNLMHKVYPQLEKCSPVKVLHIADATANEIKRQNINRVGLLGTKWTMEEDFYRSRLEKQGIEVIIPDDEDRTYVDKVIYEELCRGLFLDSSSQGYKNIIDKMKKIGAQGVILGCTEIPLLIEEASIPLFNTTLIHSLEAVKLAIEE